MIEPGTRVAFAEQALEAFARSGDARRPAILPAWIEHVDLESLFASTVRFADDPVRQSGLVKIFVDGEVPVSREEWPRLEDASFAQYGRRLASRSKSDRWMVFVSGFEATDSGLRDFIDRVLRIARVPERAMDASHGEAELFLGRYELTPGNIHKEACTNFHFMLEGQKTMLLWPEDYFDEAAASRGADNAQGYTEHYLPHLDERDFENAIRLDATVGDMFYMPAGYWHVGRAPQGAMGLNVAVYETRRE